MKRKNIINYFLLWRKFGCYAKKVRRLATRFYYVMKGSDTLKSDKFFIASAFSYLVMSVDLISVKRLSIFGWINEIVLLTVIYQKVCKFMTSAIELEVDCILSREFPEFELVPII